MSYLTNKNALSVYYLYLTLFISGATVLIIEIAGVRILAPFYGSTIFVWSSLITVTLGSLSLGYMIGGIIADKHPKTLFFYLILFIGGAVGLLLVKVSSPILEFSEIFGYRWGSLVATLLIFAIPLFLLSMASPYAIRLRSRVLERAGHVTGTIFALSTFGSLLGALLVGFYLIPNFLVDQIFTFATILIMAVAIAGLLIERISFITITALILIAALIIIIPFFAKNRAKVSVIHREPSFYGQIQVIEDEDCCRCMAVNSLLQSCIYKDEGDQAFAYGHRIISVIKWNNFRSGNALLIGLGAGIIAQDLGKRFDYVDAVDVDPKIVKIAKQYFNYDNSSKKNSTFIEDGRNFINNTDKKYDVIVMDVYSGITPLPHLFSKEVFGELKNILKPDGLLIINTIGQAFGKGSILQKSIAKTLSYVFPYYSAISTEDIEEDREAFGNIVFIASSNKDKISIKSKRYKVNYTSNDIKDGIILSDNFNPLEILGIPTYEQAQKIQQEYLGIL